MILDVATYRTTRPAILWGPGYANTLAIGMPLAQVSAYPAPADGRETRRGKVAALDVWATGVHHMLEAVVVAVPGETDVVVGPATGWDVTDGWEDFFAYARQGRPIRWVPDASAPGTYVTAELREPWTDPPSAGFAGRRTVKFVLRAWDPGVRFEGY